MKRFIDVHTGEVMAGQGEVVLQSDAKGGSMVIIAYDASHKIGALAHAILAGRHMIKRLPGAETAIDEMITDMAMLGAQRDEIKVSLVVDNLGSSNGSTEYAHGLNQTIELLKQRHVQVQENIMPGNGSAHVALDVESGVISYS